MYTGSINIRARSCDSPLSFTVYHISGNTALLLADDWLFCVPYKILGLGIESRILISFSNIERSWRKIEVYKWKWMKLIALEYIMMILKKKVNYNIALDVLNYLYQDKNEIRIFKFETNVNLSIIINNCHRW